MNLTFVSKRIFASVSKSLLPPPQCLAPPGRDGLEQQPLDGDGLAGEQGRGGDGDGVGRGGGEDEAAGRGEGGGRDGVEGGGGGGEDHGGQAEEEQALGGDTGGFEKMSYLRHL